MKRMTRKCRCPWRKHRKTCPHGAPPRRPAKMTTLLNLNKSPAANKALSNLNATASPLLRLPPEIRERIYNHVFGGNILHLHVSRGAGGLYMATVCQHPEEYDNISALCHIHSEDDDTFRNDRHATCDQRRANQTIGLSLLQTCRQIHHEAALLPFASNRFVINDASSFCCGSNSSDGSTRAYPNQRLGRAQIKAITHVIFDKGSTGWNSDVADNVWAQLIGVKVLELVLHAYLHRQYMPLHTPMDVLLKSPLCPYRINLLGQLNLSAVYVGVYLRVYNVRHNLQLSDIERLVERVRPWQRKTGSKILGTRDCVAAEKALKVAAEKAEKKALEQKRDDARRARDLRSVVRKD